MEQHFDLAVIGGGPGGYVAALKAAQLGANVALVEKHYLGGTCLNYGCIPSKALLASADLLHQMHHATAMGIQVEGQISFDWTKIQARKDKVVTGLRGGVKSLLSARKVTVFSGLGALEGRGKVAVTGSAEPTVLTATKIILAMGSVPSRIPGWPTDPEHVCTSDEALHWKSLPKSVLIAGGGVIGCEFACMLQPFGVEVTVVEMMPRALPTIDSELGDTAQKILAKRGIKFLTGTKIEEVKPGTAGVRARLDNGQEIEVEKVLVATGRRPNGGNAGLEAAGVATERGFVTVNDHLATSSPDVYCIGDLNGLCLLAHAASAQGVVAAENALGADIAFHAPIPSCIYTFPEIASVGLSEQEARDKNWPISVGRFPLSHLGKAMAAGDTEGFAKVVRHRETDQLLGVHLLGHNVTESIAAAGALLHQTATLEEVVDNVFAHPTISESIKEAAEDALMMGLHLPPRKVTKVAV